MSFLRRQHPAPEPDTDEENDENIDPELRLRTVRTAASAIAESIRSEQRAERRKSVRLRSKRSIFFRRTSESKRKPQDSGTDVTPTATPQPAQVEGQRRKVYMNMPLSAAELDAHGEPLVRYCRNKVRTAKYTIITFLPKNLYEQFRRAANIFFLIAVVAQSISIFGAPSPQISFLPLLFILTVTAIKDAIEDYRRAQIDEEVNISAVTKLENWHNVNIPKDTRAWYERLFGLNQPGKVTKGVKKLRDREASEGNRIILSRPSLVERNHGTSLHSVDSRDGRLEDIMSVDSHSYPPNSLHDPSRASLTSLAATAQPNSSPHIPPHQNPDWNLSSYEQSSRSIGSFGVVNWNKHANGIARWERTLWKKLEVGDIVLLRDNDQIPADVVVLSTSDADGLCYVETKNLDGETNLKPRRAVKATCTIASEEDLERSAFVLDSEPPHQNLYVYHGVLRYKDAQTSEDRQEPVSINELLLRGCSIRNTDWVIGMVVFTGADTKIMMNGGETPSKQSKIEKETNFNVIVNFVILMFMCVIAAVFNGILDAQSGTSAEFFEQGADPTSSSVLNALVTFVSCLIAFQNIVPISLYISIEFVKTIQAFFISQDIDMYYEALDAPCLPKTWNISDDLGQIEYIFSDKTGTLTQNVMEFQKCSIGGIPYGEGVTEAQRGAATREGQADAFNADELNANLATLKQEMLTKMERSFKNRYLQSDKLTLVSPKLATDLTDRSSPQRNNIVAFFRALAVCHSVLSEKGEKNQYHLTYKAESPDEAALVAAARDVGFPFVGKTKDYMEIEVMGQVERYVPLQLLEFNSTRKRMSVVVRAPDGKLILYCKGADSVIYARLREDHDPVLKEATAKDMEAFANNGLRTLCISYRYIDEDEYLEWSRVYEAAVNSIEDRDEAIEKANEMIEHDLIILGATALEDKLQVGVPEAIEILHRAGIKLWILTGDKVQTAIEIGYSCNLLKNDMDIMILQADDPDKARGQIEAGLNKIASVLGPPSWDPKKRGFMPGMQASFAVVIDGDTLTHALSPELKPLFLNLGTQCETVVCCRVSPAQKALTVKLVKEGRRAMTLSIGDGANDVAMIQEANIGCGLLGHEGSQAAMSADYAFGQFRFLTKLLLVHGRWSYQRIADMHANFFYKNMIWTFAMFWFLPFNSFDATYLYQYTFILLYNLAFTSLPVGILGAFDQDVHAKAALAFPQLYVRGIRGLEYTRAKFWSYMFDGLYQSAVVYFFPFMIWTFGPVVSWNGNSMDSLGDFGTTVSVAAIFCANLFVGMNTHYWTVVTWVIVWGSSIVMVAWIAIYSMAFFTSDFTDEASILYGSITFWASVVLCVVVSLAPRFLIKAWKSAYMPLDRDLVREMWVAGDLKDRLGISHRKASKNKPELSGSTLEYASMIREPHARSGSEVSLHHGGYQPAPVASPGPTSSGSIPPSYAPPHSYDVTPPRTSPIPPRSPTTLHPNDPQYIYVEPTSHNHNNYQNQQHLSPPSSATRPSIPSPNPSYYSASDIPPPSPQPETTYVYPSGETTTTPPPQSRRGSVSSRRSAAPGTPRTTPWSPAAAPLAALPAVSHSVPQSSTYPSSPVRSEYEMSVRAPVQQQGYSQQYPSSPQHSHFAQAQAQGYPQHQEQGQQHTHPQYDYSQQQHQHPTQQQQQHLGHHVERSASEASFATAADYFSEEERRSVTPHSGRPQHSGARHDDEEDGDDGATITRGPRDSVASQYTARGIAL